MAQTIHVRGGTAPLLGTCRVPGDKSISHRGLLLGALGDGPSRLRGFLNGRDCHATLQVIRDLGVRVELASHDDVLIHGVGLRGLQEPARALDCVNSGTTMRLVAGLLAGQPFSSFLVGTEQLQGRPMARVVEPLRKMGAVIVGRDGGRRAPLGIRGGELKAIAFEMPVPSAQVKSAILLAGLFAEGTTVVVEPGPTRDHTERMLAAMGAPVQSSRAEVRVCTPSSPLRPFDITVPGDPSSAAFLLVAAVCRASSRIALEGIGTNPTRHGLVEALLSMGARIAIRNTGTEGAEPVADLCVEASPLAAAVHRGDRIVKMIDEIPVLAVAATQAKGTTVIADAAELRVKETDRIATTVGELTKMGARIEATPDGMVVHGPCALRGADVESHGDHRLAMALTVAGLLATGETRVHGAEVTSDSFPGFEDTLTRLGADLRLE